MGLLFSRPKPLKSFSHVSSNPTKEYDFVIVGSSPSGCVLASRLSENPNVTVLLIEAGGNDEEYAWTQIPGAWPKNFNTDADWAFSTTPQKELNNRALFMPRGKVLGGSSSINAMIYHHSSPTDFDGYAEELKRPDWSYEALQPYFKRAERHSPHRDHKDVDLQHRGLDGMWHTGYSWAAPISQAWVKACAAVGIPYTPDINTPTGSKGVTSFATFVDPSGRRSSGSTAYLTPSVLARPNLTVCVRTRCTRVLFDETGTKAIGVEVADERAGMKGPKVGAMAKKEVLLCAGAIGSSHLLLLSGLGPKAELEKLGVKVVRDMRHVGRNLQDHLSACIVFRAKPQYSFDPLGQSALKGLLSLARWALGLGGVMTSNGAEVGAFIRSDDPSLGFLPPVDKPIGDSGAPDIELIASPVSFYDHYRAVPPNGSTGMAMCALLLRPRSKGAVTLKSSDPWDAPLIDPNYLSNPADVPPLINSLRLLLRLARLPQLSAYLSPNDRKGKDPNDTVGGGWEEEVYALGDCTENEVTDIELKAWARRRTETLYHPVSTARMSLSEETGVVDADLRVHGMQGLRICDAAVFPSIPSGHPTAPVIAFAEKAADLITDTREI